MGTRTLEYTFPDLLILLHWYFSRKRTWVTIKSLNLPLVDLINHLQIYSHISFNTYWKHQTSFEMRVAPSKLRQNIRINWFIMYNNISLFAWLPLIWVMGIAQVKGKQGNSSSSKTEIKSKYTFLEILHAFLFRLKCC